MKRLLLIAFVFSLTGSVALGQDGTESQASSGSVYSKLGIGYPVGIENTASSSAGLLGVSFNQPNVGSLANPAHWGSTVYGLGSGGLSLQSYKATAGNNSATNVSFSPNQFQLQLPIIRGKFGISGSFAPLSRSNFRIFRQTTRFVDRGSIQDTLQYTIENTGSGGVNRAEVGFGWKINDHISVGYAPSVAFISQDEEFTSSFNDLTYRRVSYTYETSGVGMGNRFGTFIQVPNLFRQDDQVGIGATVNLPVTINANRQKISGEIVETSDPVDLGDGTIRMPSKISGGISYSPSNILMIGVDGLYQGWSSYSNDFSTPQSSVSYVDRYKMGMGMQYFPYLTDSDNFLSNFKYRFGASYDTGHLSIRSQRINTLMFSMGLGILSPNSNSSIDLSLEYGIRGTNSSNLAKEQVWGLELSLNLSEIMFFRPKLQ